MQVELQPTYLLSSKSYLETSLLGEFFTKEYGRISMVIRGAKRKHNAGILQPFNHLLISWKGRGPLFTLSNFEAIRCHGLFPAKTLIVGLYINELIVKTLAHGDPHTELFDIYHKIFQTLIVANDPRYLLRIFEKHLLIAIGYALPLITNITTELTIKENKSYGFDLEKGPIAIDQVAPGSETFKGSSLLALHYETLTEDDLLDAKRLLRAAINFRLGNKVLHSRALL